MEHRCNEVEKELYEFKEQYARNGKEILRFAMSIENITKEVRDHHKFSEDNKIKRESEEALFRKELEPVLDSYYTLINGRKWIFRTSTFFFTIGSAYLLYKQIFHK